MHYFSIEWYRSQLEAALVLCGQAAFYSLSLGREEKGSGPLRIPQSSHNNAPRALKLGYNRLQ